MASSRTRHLEGELHTLGFKMAMLAFQLVKSEMNAEKGYTRHNGTHYYYHCVDVAQKLINFGIKEKHTFQIEGSVTDEEIITAALLHDIVEDVSKFTIQWISEHFNQNVASMIQLLTKKPEIDYKNPTHLTSYLNKISEHPGAALIKTADRMHNFGTLKDADVDKKLRYSEETRLYFIPFFKKCRKLYPRYASFFFEAKTQIEPQLWEIEEHYSEVEQLKKRILLLEKKIKHQS